MQHFYNFVSFNKIINTGNDSLKNFFYFFQLLKLYMSCENLSMNCVKFCRFLYLFAEDGI